MLSPGSIWYRQKHPTPERLQQLTPGLWLQTPNPSCSQRLPEIPAYSCWTPAGKISDGCTLPPGANLNILVRSTGSSPIGPLWHFQLHLCCPLILSNQSNQSTVFLLTCTCIQLICHVPHVFEMVTYPTTPFFPFYLFLTLISNIPKWKII